MEAEAAHKQISNFECSGFGRRVEARFAQRAFGTAPFTRVRVGVRFEALTLLADAVVAYSLSNSELIRGRQLDEHLPLPDENWRRNSGRSNGSKHLERNYFCLDAFFSCIAG